MKRTIKKIFLHGWATDKRVWAIEDSSSNIALDFGRGSWEKPTLDGGVRELLNAIEDDEKPVAIGWSLGAAAVMQAAVKKPSAFHAIILVGATPSFTTKDDFPFGQKKSIVKRMLMDMKKNTQDTLKRFYKLNFTEDELKTPSAKRFLKLYEKTSFDSGELTTSLEALTSADLRKDISAINIPTLIIHGEKDNITPIGAGIYLKNKIKNAKLKIFKKCGHAPFITEPEKFKRAVEEFIERI